MDAAQPARSRQRLRPWLEANLNSNRIPGLEWLDKANKIWKLPWRHHRKTCWGHEDAFLLQELAKHMYDYRRNDEPKPAELKRWKELLRNALTSFPDVKELKDLHVQEEPHFFKVYQFVYNGTETGLKTRRRQQQQAIEQDNSKYGTECVPDEQSDAPMFLGPAQGVMAPVVLTVGSITTASNGPGQISHLEILDQHSQEPHTEGLQNGAHFDAFQMYRQQENISPSDQMVRPTAAPYNNIFDNPPSTHSPASFRILDENSSSCEGADLLGDLNDIEVDEIAETFACSEFTNLENGLPSFQWRSRSPLSNSLISEVLTNACQTPQNGISRSTIQKKETNVLAESAIQQNVPVTISQLPQNAMVYNGYTNGDMHDSLSRSNACNDVPEVTCSQLPTVVSEMTVASVSIHPTSPLLNNCEMANSHPHQGISGSGQVSKEDNLPWSKRHESKSGPHGNNFGTDSTYLIHGSNSQPLTHDVETDGGPSSCRANNLNHSYTEALQILCGENSQMIPSNQGLQFEASELCPANMKQARALGQGNFNAGMKDLQHRKMAADTEMNPSAFEKNQNYQTSSNLRDSTSRKSSQDANKLRDLTLPYSQPLSSDEGAVMFVSVHYYKSLVLSEPVKFDKFRLCFAKDEASREFLRHDPWETQRGMNEFIPLVEFPPSQNCPDLNEIQSRYFTTTLNKVKRGIFVLYDQRDKNIYATRLCKARVFFTSPGAMRIQMERQKIYKIFDFNNFSKQMISHRNQFATKHYVTLTIACEERKLITVNIIHWEAFQALPKVTSLDLLEPEASLSDDFDNKLSIDQIVRESSGMSVYDECES